MTPRSGRWVFGAWAIANALAAAGAAKQGKAWEAAAWAWTGGLLATVAIAAFLLAAEDDDA